MRRRVTTSSAWRVHSWRPSSHNKMALWISLTHSRGVQTTTRTSTHKHTKRFHFTFSSLMSNKSVELQEVRGRHRVTLYEGGSALFVNQSSRSLRWEINAARLYSLFFSLPFILSVPPKCKCFWKLAGLWSFQRAVPFVCRLLWVIRFYSAEKEVLTHPGVHVRGPRRKAQQVWSALERP